MKKNKKLLVSFLALNAILSSYTVGAKAPVLKSERMYTNILKNMEQGKSNEENYQIIERILKLKNKELKDLYLQGDYIVKPEYLEWQVFFTGFYEEYNEGVDNSKENARLHSKVTGYYDADGNYISTGGSINGLMGKAYQPLQKSKEINLGISIQVREPNKQPISLGVSKPSMPLITPIAPTTPSIIGITPILPPLASFSVPNIGNPSPPGGVSVTQPTITPINISSFSPVEPKVTPSSLAAPPNFSILLGADWNSWSSSGNGNGDYNHARASYTDGSGFVNRLHYTWARNSGAEKRYAFKLGNDEGTMSAPYTLSGTYNFDSFNTDSSGISVNAWKNGATNINVQESQGINLNNQRFFIGGSRFFEFDNGSGNLLLSGTLNLKGILTLGLVTQGNNAGDTKSIENSGTITDKTEKDDPFIQDSSISGTIVGPVEVLYDINKSADGYIGYKVGIALVQENANSGTEKLDLINTGTIDFRGKNSIGMYVYLPSITSGTTRLENRNTISMSGKESYGMKFGASTNANFKGVTNTGTIELRKNPDGTDKADLSAGIAIMDDATVTSKVNIGVGNVKNTGNIILKDNIEDSIGMYLRILGNNDIENTSTGIITVSSTGSGNVGMRVDTGTINIGVGSPLAKNSGAINVSGGANFGMIANDINSGRVATIQNLAGANINISGESSAGMYSTAGGMAENSGIISVSGNDSIGIFSTTAAANKMTTGSILLTGVRAAGVYNTDTFTLSGGNITSGAVNSIGIYADNTNSTSITGGNVTAQNGGIALFSGNNSTINLSGSSILTANSGGLLFYNYMNGSGIYTGKYNIAIGTTATVNSGGLALYMKVGNVSDIGTALMSLKGAYINPANLTVNMASGSSILYIDGVSGAASISALNTAGLTLGGMTGFFNFSGSGYSEYVMKGTDLTLDDTSHSNLDSSTYSNIQFLQSSVTVNNGITVAGTQADQVAIAQKNAVGGTVSGINITNNGTISLTGSGATAIAGDFITMKNTATGSINLGAGSVGMYTANGSIAVNEGTIELGAGSVGMYGRNDFGSTAAAYGDRKINIENQKDIKTISGEVTGNVTGIYTDNALTLADASVNLTSTSNIDLEGIGIIVGVYLKKTNLASTGKIKVTSSGGTSVGLYGDESTATSIAGSIEVLGGSSTGIYLKNSTMSSGSAVKVDNVTSGIGMYVEATTTASTGTNTGTISLGDNVTGMYGSGASAVNIGTITNIGTIQSLTTSADDAIGMYIGSNGIGNNSGNIYLIAVGTNENQVGVYNSGTFVMTGGNIEVYSKNGAGLYATNTASLSGGIIKTGNGAIGLYADGATINLSGTYKSIVEDGGIFALNDNSGTIDVTGNIVVDVEAGGMAFSSVGALNTYLSSLVIGTGTLEINLKDPTSKLAILDSPGTILLSSLGAIYAPGSTIIPQVKISSSSDPNYTPFSITKGTLIVDQPVNLDSNVDSYNKSDFINSSITINDTITGTNSGQLAVGQVNYGSGSAAIDRARITINNNSMIELSGNNSTGILADFGDITNLSTIKVTGSNSVGVYATNGTEITNSGTINIGDQSVGIYGINYLSTPESYGNGTINITNNGNIISTGTIHGGYGIYANNTSGLATSINIGAGSNIDVSTGNDGIGIYAVDTSGSTTLNIDGTITVGKNGVGVYASGITTGNINGGIVNLIGDNAIGYYLTNGSLFTNNAGSIHVDGQNITLMITDASSNINLSTPFTVTSTLGSTYVVGNMIGGDFYNTTSVTLGSNGSLINGIGTAALFGTASNINSTGTNVSGMVLSGQRAGVPGHVVTGSAISVNEEGTNLGIIALGDASAGMYLVNGARGRNEGVINVNDNSVGIYAEGTGSHIVNNNGIITVGQESTGLFLKNGKKIENIGTSEINSTNQKAVGIYSENMGVASINVTNNNKINLSGDQSIGIYTTGDSNISNTGLILIGNAVSELQPGVGIYSDNSNSMVNNTGTITVGNNSIGIYNLNGSVTNNSSIIAGDGGTGIYSDGGSITLNAGASIVVGQNNGVGVYALNQTGTIINDSSLTVGDSSYGFVFSGGTPAFTNNQPATIGNNGIYMFADSSLTSTNNGVITMTGSNSIGYYLKAGGTFLNNADIIGNIGTANIGVYAKGANIINNADIILGDSSLIEHVDVNGKKYKTGYSVGIYGENSNVTNNTGKTIQIGKEGIGIYVKGTGYSAENRGIINGFGNETKGIYVADYAIVKNYGTINMIGDNVMGIAGQNGAQIYNDYSGIINVTGNDVTGIYLAGDDTTLINHGQINITGTGLGIAYTPTVEQSNVTDSTGTTQGYTSKQYDLPDMPTLVNTGEININVGGNFNYDGIRVIVTVDPSNPNTSITNSSSKVGFGGVIPDKLEIAPDFAVGTASDRYIFENIFRGATGNGDYISQSLTWDATAQGSNLVMTRKAYTDFTDGLWYEDFGRELNEKYATTMGEGRKIYDKINHITNEEDFRHIMGSLAGNVYSNINQRENDISRTFENSLDFIENSENNTKENVKINVIGGKGKNKEETDGVVDYDYTTTGILALREVERTYKHKFGYSLGYLHTGFEFKDGNESEEKVDTIQLGVHNKYKTNNWVLKNDLMGRVSFHNIDRNIDWPSPLKRSEMNGTYETHSITSDNRLGREFELGKKSSIMPYAGLRAMYVTRPTFKESGLEALEVKGNDAWSVKPRAGVELQTALPIGNTAWQVKGSVDLAYEYELSDLNKREKAKLVAIEDGYHKLSKPEDEKGIFRTKASVGAEVKDRYGIFITGEYLTGEDKEDDCRAGVTLKAVF